MVVLYYDVLVLVQLELDFGELVCNPLVSNCREQCALDGGLGEALDEDHGGVPGGVLDGVLDGGAGGWVREADSWVSSCSSSCGELSLEVESEGLEGMWTCQSSSILPQDSSGGSL